MHSFLSRAVAVGALCLGMAFAVQAATPTREETQQMNAMLAKDSPFIGDAKADVTIIEFFDYTCSYCKAVEPRLAQFLKADKHVKLVLKEFPILTPESLVASKVALAAVKQGKYGVYHQAMMRLDGPLDEAAIFGTAKSVGLDVARLKRDMKAPEISDAIIANFNLARSLRQFQTPIFIVNGFILGGESAKINFPQVAAAARKK